MVVEQRRIKIVHGTVSSWLLLVCDSGAVTQVGEVERGRVVRLTKERGMSPKNVNAAPKN